MSRIGNFLADYANLCRHHGLCLSHEDVHGGFEVMALDEDIVSWATAARDRVIGDAPCVGRLLPDGEST